MRHAKRVASGSQNAFGEDRAVAVLSKPTGAGKTLVIVASTNACCRMMQPNTPTVLLTEFMTSTLKKHNKSIRVITLDFVTNDDDIAALKKAFRDFAKLRKENVGKPRFVVIISPHKLEKRKWCGKFSMLARSDVLHLVVNDEAHLTARHGKTFR